MSLEELARGRMLYLRKCASCHRPVLPNAIAVEDWPFEIAMMKKRSKLDDEQIKLIMRYLITIATRPKIEPVKPR